MKSFYAHFPSDSSDDIYPSNAANNYIVKLPAPIELDGTWEIGLAEILFPRIGIRMQDDPPAKKSRRTLDNNFVAKLLAKLADKDKLDPADVHMLTLELLHDTTPTIEHLKSLVDKIGPSLNEEQYDTLIGLIKSYKPSVYETMQDRLFEHANMLFEGEFNTPYNRIDLERIQLLKHSFDAIYHTELQFHQNYKREINNWVVQLKRLLPQARPHIVHEKIRELVAIGRPVERPLPHGRSTELFLVKLGKMAERGSDLDIEELAFLKLRLREQIDLMNELATTRFDRMDHYEIEQNFETLRNKFSTIRPVPIPMHAFDDIQNKAHETLYPLGQYNDYDTRWPSMLAQQTREFRRYAGLQAKWANLVMSYFDLIDDSVRPGDDSTDARRRMAQFPDTMGFSVPHLPPNSTDEDLIAAHDTLERIGLEISRQYQWYKMITLGVIDEDEEMQRKEIDKQVIDAFEVARQEREKLAKARSQAEALLTEEELKLQTEEKRLTEATEHMRILQEQVKITIKDLTGQVDRMKGERLATEKKIHALESESKRIEEAKAKLAKDLIDLEIERAKNDKLIEDAKKAAEEEKTKALVLKDLEILELKTQLEQRIGNLERDEQQLAQRKQQLEHDLADLQRRENELEKRRESEQKEHDKLAEEIRLLRQSESEIRDNLGSLQVQRDKLEQQRVAEAAALDALRAQTKALEESAETSAEKARKAEELATKKAEDTTRADKDRQTALAAAERARQTRQKAESDLALARGNLVQLDKERDERKRKEKEELDRYHAEREQRRLETAEFARLQQENEQKVRDLEEKLRKLEKKKVKTEEHEDHTASNYMYVYSDLAEPQVVGNTYSQLLRVINVPRTLAKTHDIVFDNVHYVPLHKKYFHTVEIDIRNSHGEPMIFAPGEVVVKVHFRQN